jgi:hypothetical protein
VLPAPSTRDLGRQREEHVRENDSVHVERSFVLELDAALGKARDLSPALDGDFVRENEVREPRVNHLDPESS